MENRSDRISLILLSMVFVLVGGFTIIAASRGALFPNMCLKDFKVYSSGDLISESEDRECFCLGGKVVCSEKEGVQENGDLEISDFIRSNLEFEYKYFSAGVSSELFQKPQATSFTSIVTAKSAIEVQVQQAQLCSESGKPPVQIGLYNYRDNTLTVLNAVNTIESIYKVPCTVTLVYKISKFEISNVEDFKLVYRSESGESISADVCLYNGNVYNDGDNYVSMDKCNLCRCVEGISRCSTEKKCE